MRLFKGISAIAFSIFALVSFNANAESVVVDSGTCYSYGCATPSQSCTNRGGNFYVNGTTNQYTCTVNYTPPVVVVEPPKTWVVIASGTCYSYGCQSPAQYCSSQGGAFSVNGSNQYTCKKLM